MEEPSNDSIEYELFTPEITAEFPKHKFPIFYDLELQYHQIQEKYYMEDAIYMNKLYKGLAEKFQLLLKENECLVHTYVIDAPLTPPKPPFTYAYHNSFVTLTSSKPEPNQNNLTDGNLIILEDYPLWPTKFAHEENDNFALLEAFFLSTEEERKQNDYLKKIDFYKVLASDSNIASPKKGVTPEKNKFTLFNLPCIAYTVSNKLRLSTNPPSPKDHKPKVPAYIFIELQITADPHYEHKDTKDIQKALPRSPSIYIWILKFLTMIVNSYKFHDIRMRYFETLKGVYLLEMDFYKLKHCSFSYHNDCTVGYQGTEDSNFLACVSGKINANIFKMLRILYDTDFEHLWIPFCSKSSKLIEFYSARQVVHQLNSFPWPLNAREFLLNGSCIMILKTGITEISIIAPSIPDNCSTYFGIPIDSPGKDVVRGSMKFMVFSLQILEDEPEHVMLKSILYIDPKIKFLPKFVLNFIAKQFVIRLFENLKQLSENFKNTVYAKSNDYIDSIFAGKRTDYDLYVIW